jgi:hypothetical protein
MLDLTGGDAAALAEARAALDRIAAQDAPDPADAKPRPDFFCWRGCDPPARRSPRFSPAIKQQSRLKARGGQRHCPMIMRERQ